MRPRAALAFAAALATSCATFRGGKVPRVHQFPSMPGTPPRVNVKLSFQPSMNGLPQDIRRPEIHKRLLDICLARLQQSKLFGVVGTDVQNPDAVVDITFKDDGRGNLVLAVVTGLTLYAIPSWSTDNLILDARVTDRRSTASSAIHIEESVTLYQQILLLPLAPFTLLPVVASRAQRDMFDNPALQVRRALVG